VKYAIKTLGCKVNQVDSICLAETLEELGLTRAVEGEAAEVCVINTCTVTARTDTQCRQMIRRAVRENPGAHVVVTGCYAEIAPEAVRAIDGVARVLGNRDKQNARRLLAETLTSDGNVRLSARDHVPPAAAERLPNKIGRAPGLIHGAGGRSRAFVRVQDGCNAFCAYCIVPYARGPVKSEEPDHVVDQVQALVDRGFPEIVLSGIHLGAYGLDRNERRGLAGLLRRLVRIQGDFRIRLSSLEPGEVDQELIDLLSGEPKICRHLHIPLQSGDNEILSRMKRPYTREYFEELVFRLRDMDRSMAIGTDMIAGLPGETHDSFERTCRWVSSLPLTHFHIFPYSPRPGTPAAAMEGQVDAAARKERASRLRTLCQGITRSFLRQMVGKRLEVVGISDGASVGEPAKVLTDNYLEGLIVTPPGFGSGIFSVKFSGISDDKLLIEVKKQS
jgi:threonylcarbamoyladenosine tRNA methylthiotransferase MtaB